MNEVEIVHEGVIGNKVRYQILALESFSGISEIAIKIEGELSSVVTIEPKRTGKIVCKPSLANKVIIKKGEGINLEEIKEPDPIDMSDVVGKINEEDEDDEI